MNRLEELGEYARSLGCAVSFGEPMNRHTTFRIGGPADLFLTADDTQVLQKLCRRSSETGVRVTVLGNGSNLLVSDAGIRGAVFQLGGKFREIALCGETSVRCGAGASLASLCSFAKSRSLTGMEFAWGIPGSAGGAAFMNAGAYEHCMAEVVSSCSHVTRDGGCGTLRGEDLRYGYRRSAYAENGCIVTSVKVDLKRGDPEAIAARMDELYARRKSKQPLELPSAGSVFKRPEGHYAGTLIEQCGLKGRRVGGAAVSEKHAGFIVNLGGATCGDVRGLIEVIRETVLRETGVELECEIKTAE